MGVNWAEVWAFVWPILKQGLIALLVSVLGLMGYDKIVPSRYARRSGEALTPEAAIYAKHKAEGHAFTEKQVDAVKLGRPRLDDGETQRTRRA